MLTHEDFALKPTELDRINRLIATQSKAMWDGGETSDGLSLTFSFGTFGLRSVQFSLSGGRPVQIDQEWIEVLGRDSQAQ